MRTTWWAVTTLAAAACAGCSPAPAPFVLDGTSWQLIAIQSMDNSQGTTTVPDPTKFTVTFDADGQASFQLDCNRGSGTFETEESSDPNSGSRTFGPIASTLMGCPQPSLDQRVGPALALVRSYLYEGGHLHMSQVADGDILSWRRA